MVVCGYCWFCFPKDGNKLDSVRVRLKAEAPTDMWGSIPANVFETKPSRIIPKMSDLSSHEVSIDMTLAVEA